MEWVTVPSSLCSATTFTYPTIAGVEFLSIEASLVQNFSRYVSDQDYLNNPEIFVEDATFCNLTLSYTHHGQDDVLFVESWLPIPWNSRLQAVGGGGWTGGRTELAISEMAGAIGNGWYVQSIHVYRQRDATITTDAGLGHSEVPVEWALLKPGNVNWVALQNLGHVSLNEQAIIGKKLANDFYDKPPLYSYFIGCSQGGRQGLELAQRYPDAYDGIAAATPAVYWSQFFQVMLWAQMVMKEIDEYPRGCELDYLQKAVIEKCDADDGIEDGIILDPTKCQFDPVSVVGTRFSCSDTGRDMEISNGAATIFKAYHAGAKDPDGNFLWHGPHYGSNLTRTIFGTPGLAATTCTEEGCVGRPFEFGLFWTGLFGMKDPTWEFTEMTMDQFNETFHRAAAEYASTLGTSDPDLDRFRDAGGKMITFHGLMDDLCPSKGTEQYYNEVWKRDENIHDFYKFYEVPGLGHCYGGNGGQPTGIFEALRAWVETDKVPESLVIDVPRQAATEKRVICPYPQKVRFRHGHEEGKS
ncbi:unnamed protein product, partial [Clonostachys rosea]